MAFGRLDRRRALAQLAPDGSFADHVAADGCPRTRSSSRATTATARTASTRATTRRPRRPADFARGDALVARCTRRCGPRRRCSRRPLLVDHVRRARRVLRPRAAADGTSAAPEPFGAPRRPRLLAVGRVVRQQPHSRFAFRLSGRGCPRSSCPPRSPPTVGRHALRPYRRPRHGARAVRAGRRAAVGPRRPVEHARPTCGGSPRPADDLPDLSGLAGPGPLAADGAPVERDDQFARQLRRARASSSGTSCGRARPGCSPSTTPPRCSPPPRTPPAAADARAGRAPCAARHLTGLFDFW